MKVVILAFDGLDAEYVEKFNLRSLKQAEWGKVDLTPVSEFTSINTIEVFACFLTGRPARALGRDFFRKGVIREGEVPTIFEAAKLALDVEVPCYRKSLGVRHRVLRSWIERVLKGQLNPRKFERLVWRYAVSVERELFDLIEGWDWELIMAYFPFTDLLGHVHTDLTKMWETYAVAEGIVERVKRAVEPKYYGRCRVLVFSDHGLQNRFHTDYGYYSINTYVGLGRPKVTDFHDLIARWLKE